VAEAAVIPLADPPRGMSAKGDAVVATIIVNRFRVSAQQLLLGFMRVGFLRILNAQDACIVLSTGFRSDNERRRLERLHVHEVCRIDDNPAGGFPEALAAARRREALSGGVENTGRLADFAESTVRQSDAEQGAH
jgi:hypothetical protein